MSEQMVLVRAVDMLPPEVAGALRDEYENPSACSFFACPGPDVEPIAMATCSFCGLMAELAQRAGRPVQSADDYWAEKDASLGAFGEEQV